MSILRQPKSRLRKQCGSLLILLLLAFYLISPTLVTRAAFVPPLRVLFVEGNGQSTGEPFEPSLEQLQNITVDGGTVYISSEHFDTESDSSLVPADGDPTYDQRAYELSLGLVEPLPKNAILIDFDMDLTDASIDPTIEGRDWLAYQANGGMAYTTDYLYASDEGTYRLKQLFAHLTRDYVTEDELVLYYSEEDETQVFHVGQVENSDDATADVEEVVETPTNTTSPNEEASMETSPGVVMIQEAEANETTTTSPTEKEEVRPVVKVTDPVASNPIESDPIESDPAKEPAKENEEDTTKPTEPTAAPTEPIEEPTEATPVETGPTTTDPDLITVVSLSPEEQDLLDVKEGLDKVLGPVVKKETTSTETAEAEESTTTLPQRQERDDSPVKIVDLTTQEQEDEEEDESEEVQVKDVPEEAEDAEARFGPIIADEDSTDNPEDPKDNADDESKTTETNVAEETKTQVAPVEAVEEDVESYAAPITKLDQRFKKLEEASNLLESYLPSLPEENAFVARLQQRRIKELSEELKGQIATNEQRAIYDKAQDILQRSEDKLEISSTVVVIGETGERLLLPLAFGGTLFLIGVILFVVRRKQHLYE